MIPFAMGLDTAIALFKRWRWLLLAVPMALALGIQTYRLKSARVDLLEKQATISNMKLASEQARKDQIALNQATEAKTKAEAERTDHAHQIEVAHLGRIAADFADRNRVRNYCEGSARQAGGAAEGAVAASGDGPGDDAILLSPADFDTLNENTLRLKAVNEWGQRLISEGLAE